MQINKLLEIFNKLIDHKLDENIKKTLIKKTDNLNLINNKASLNSKEIKSGDIFFAYPGQLVDGRDYITQALNNGAKYIIYESSDLTKNQINSNINHIYISIPIPNLKDKLALFAKILYPINSNKISNITAITGTNGKSSTAHYLALLDNLINNINNNNNINASIGTLGCYIYNTNNNYKLTNTYHTTPDQLSLWRNINNICKIKANKINLVLEASSHALDQNRLEFIPINTAIFTNFSQDHLDYHKTIDNYFKSKLNLFIKYPELKYAVIHLDPLLTNQQLNLLLNQVSNNKNIKFYTYSISIQNNKNNINNINNINNPDFYYSEIKYTNHGFMARLKTPWGEVDLNNINLYGEFNLANILASYITKILHNNIDNIKDAKKISGYLSKITPLNGRMMPVNFNNKSNKIFIDYAHTPDAIKQALTALKQHFPDANIIILFGCGGDRDRSKRHIMVKSALNIANNLILTNDNPRNENPNQIFNDMLLDINLKNSNKIKIIQDREQAIIYALNKYIINNNKTPKILLLAGKGHETSIKIKNKLIICNEQEIINNFFKLTLATPKV